MTLSRKEREDKEDAKVDREQKDAEPISAPWADLVLVFVLAGLGFYFFGPFGAVGGFALGVIITLGF
jgi:hypothetical protein